MNSAVSDFHEKISILVSLRMILRLHWQRCVIPDHSYAPEHSCAYQICPTRNTCSRRDNAPEILQINVVEVFAPKINSKYIGKIIVNSWGKVIAWFWKSWRGDNCHFRQPKDEKLNRLYMRMYVYTYIIHTHKYTHINIQTCVHTYIHTCIHTCTHASTSTYNHAFKHTYTHTRINTCASTYKHTNMHTYIRTPTQSLPRKDE